MARPDLDDEFDEDEFVDEFGGDERPQPWHNSTGAVIGASALGIVVIGVLIAAVMFMTRHDDTPQAPAEFVDPTFSATAAETTSTTTTETITSTARVSTTEINAPPGPSTTSDTSSTSGSSTTSSGESPPPATIHTRETEPSPGAPTSRRPRFNVTRTLPPQQAG